MAIIREPDRYILTEEDAKAFNNKFNKDYLKFLKNTKLSKSQINQQMVIFENEDELLEGYNESEFRDS